MSLFANLAGWSRGSTSASIDASQSPSKSSQFTTTKGANRHGNYGYFVFQYPQAQVDSPPSGSSGSPQPSPTESQAPRTSSPPPNANHTPQLAPSPRAREEHEAALASEIDWVRSGGTLRDKDGRRDFARTDAIREEIRLEEEEKATLTAWRAYEDRWAKLLKLDLDQSSDPSSLSPSLDQIQFHDIPWPVSVAGAQAGRTIELTDLTLDAVREFLFSTLRVRSMQGKTSKRHIVKMSLLRWHPDKLGGVMKRVGEEEEERRIKEGVSAVVVCLQKLKEELGR